jgi:hypothetical protein
MAQLVGADPGRKRLLSCGYLKTYDGQSNETLLLSDSTSSLTIVD